MKQKATLMILGSGGSMGVPVIGCDCEICLSNDPKNQRTRPSALLQYQGKQILIDCGPDFRYQALSCRLQGIDGLILTHAHQDHVAGLDELRILCLRSHMPIPALMSTATLQDLQQRFSYMFKNKLTSDTIPKIQVTRFDVTELPEKRGNIDFLGIPIKYFSYEQAGMEVTGFRFGSLGYVSDIHLYPETIFEDLKGVNTLIISALRFTHSHFHFTVDEAVDFAVKVAAKQTRLIHLSHELDYDKTNAYLPDNIRLAYDNMPIEFDWDPSL